MTIPDVEMLVRDNIAYTANYQAANALLRATGHGSLEFLQYLKRHPSRETRRLFLLEFAPQGDALEAIEHTQNIKFNLIPS